jgi:hypothetical protein
LQRSETGPSFRFFWYNDGDNFDDLLHIARQAWMAYTLFMLLLLLLMMNDNLLHENKHNG